MTRNIRLGLVLSAALLVGWTTVDVALGQTPTVRREECAIGDRVGASYGILEGGVRVNATVTQIKPIEQVVIVLDGSGSMIPIYPQLVEALRKALPARRRADGYCALQRPESRLTRLHHFPYGA